MRPHSRLARTGAVVLIAVVLAVTASCSGQASSGKGSVGLRGEPAAQILRKAGAAGQALRSVRVSGRISGVSFDEFIASPCQAAGTFHFGSAVLTIIRIGTILYFRGNRDYYRNLGISPVPGRVRRWQESSVQAAVRARILPGPEVCMKAFLGIWSRLPARASGAITKGAIRKIRGQPALTLLDSRHDALYVAANGPPYVLALAVQGGSYINFSRFNQPVTIRAPAACPPAGPAVTSGKASVVC